MYGKNVVESQQAIPNIEIVLVYRHPSESHLLATSCKMRKIVYGMLAPCQLLTQGVTACMKLTLGRQPTPYEVDVCLFVCLFVLPFATFLNRCSESCGS